VGDWPPGLPVETVRIARPTDRLEEIVRFYRDGLGLAELGRFEGHAGYDGAILGLPVRSYQLEFTSRVDGSLGQAPSRDNLLVLYLADQAAVDATAARLESLGHPRVEAENPWWSEHGAVTIADPDGWRIVLVPPES
jgi:catechol 2,3-dioxygenase-like lactoylglutathione lyase family enzyme